MPSVLLAVIDALGIFLQRTCLTRCCFFSPLWKWKLIFDILNAEIQQEEQFFFSRGEIEKSKLNAICTSRQLKVKCQNGKTASATIWDLASPLTNTARKGAIRETLTENWLSHNYSPLFEIWDFQEKERGVKRWLKHVRRLGFIQLTRIACAAVC